jgi:hypothetical protein
MIKGKRGKTLANIVLVGVLIVVGIIGFLYTNSAIKGDASANAAERITKQVIDVTITILNSTIGLLVGTEGLESSLAFLRIIVFLLLATVIVASFDSIKIFGDDERAKWVNLLVGVIVAVIGVRFLPEDMWVAITAPSSALVFAVMMGLPLVALIFVITKIKVEIVRKIIVAGYIVALIVIFYQLQEGTYRTMALVFVAVALLLLLFDAQFIRYVRKESAKRDVATTMYKRGILHRKELRDEMKKWQAVMLDSDASNEEKNEARKMLRELSELSQESSA